MSTNWVTQQAAAYYASVKPETITDWVLLGLIRAYQTPDGQPVYSLTEVMTTKDNQDIEQEWINYA